MIIGWRKRIFTMSEITTMKKIRCLNCELVNSFTARICESCRRSLIVDNYGLTDLYTIFDELLEPLAAALRETSGEGLSAECIRS